jgi:hypothetical protein
LPAEYINWYAAITYCNKLSIMEGKTPCYSIPAIDSLDLSAGGADYHGWKNISGAYATDGVDNFHEVYAGSYATTEDADSLNLVGWYYGNTASSSGCSTAPFYGTQPVKEKRANVFGLYERCRLEPAPPRTSETDTTVSAWFAVRNKKCPSGHWLRRTLFHINRKDAVQPHTGLHLWCNRTFLLI